MSWRYGQISFIDTFISELDVPGDPDLVPDRHIDAGVVPWAMLEYLKHADRFPISPVIAWATPLLKVCEGGRCVWAGREARWPHPIRSVFFDDGNVVPESFRARTYAFNADIDDDDPDGALRAQVLCFSRPVSKSEAEIAEKGVHQLVERSRKRHVVAFSEDKDLHWPEANVLCWRTPIAAHSEDRSGALPLLEMFNNMRREKLPIAAFNGRKIY